MKNIYLALLLSGLLMGGCMTSKKYLQNAQYGAAVNKSIKKLRKKPGKIKEIDILKQAFERANQQDKDRISFLKASGQPDIWNDVFYQYNQLKSRQEMVRTAPASVLSAIGFIPTNYDQEIIAAQKKAAEYFYAHALSLLAKNDRMAAREAYHDLTQVKNFYHDYKDVDERMAEAVFKGTNNVLFSIENKSGIPLPERFEEDLLKISLKDLNTQWLNYDLVRNEDRFYDYAIRLSIKTIAVSPEQVTTKEWTEEKEIEDGFKYQLDANGNVQKDTAGNDIKIPVIKVITAGIAQTQQRKAATVGGTVDYINNRSGQLVKTHPISSETLFDHFSAVIVGDHRALKPETKKLLGSKPQPFPPDPAMIMDAGAILKGLAKNIIWENKGLLTY